MLLKKKVNWRTYISIVLMVFCLLNISIAKSLYVLDHNSKLMAFNINVDSLTFQKEIDLFNWGHGGIDIAIDDDSDILFATFEYNNVTGGNIIELVAANNLENIGNISLEGPSGLNITGLAYDNARNKLYGTNRNTNELFVYDWDASSLTLEADPNNPFELSQINDACGLALNGEYLYVSDYHYSTGAGTHSQYVYVYDVTNNFSFVKRIDMGNDTVAIAYNSTDDALYGGAYGSGNHLIRRNFDPNSTYDENSGAEVIAVAADGDFADTVFTTSYKNGGSIEIWDTSDWPIDPNITPTPEPVFTYNSQNDDNILISNLAGIEIGGPYKTHPKGLKFEKTASIENSSSCLDPTDPNKNEITFTVYYENYETDTQDPNYIGTLTNVVIRDYITYDMFYDVTYSLSGFDIECSDPNFHEAGVDGNTQSYFEWEIGTLAPGDSGSKIFTVEVTKQCMPGDYVYNLAEFESDNYYTTVKQKTDVCCWQDPDSVSGVIYVDSRSQASGIGNGTSWERAYKNLNYALERAADSCGDEIWVAQGTYSPGSDSSSRYSLVSGVDVYGGFKGNETALSQSDPHRYKTYLTGNNVCDNVIYAEDVTSGLLDGFIISDANQDGVYFDNSDVDISWCAVHDNGSDGIELLNGSDPDICNCNIYDNADHGINVNSSNCDPTIKHCVIHHNGNESGNAYGIYLDEPSSVIDITGCTIANNKNEAVYQNDGSSYGNVYDCILWHNNAENSYAFQGYGSISVTYSCYTDPNYPAGDGPNADVPDAYYNITSNPEFAYADANYYNYHLDYDSPCKDMGSTTSASGEYDMDVDNRVVDSYMEMGADEISCSDTDHVLDFDADGRVNYREFSAFAGAWLSEDPNNCTNCDPNTTNHWDSRCDRDDDYDVDLDDLVYLVASGTWTWEACWLSDGGGIPMGGESMMMGMSGFYMAQGSIEIEEEDSEQIDMDRNVLLDMAYWMETTWLVNQDIFSEEETDAWQDFMELLLDKVNKQ